MTAAPAGRPVLLIGGPTASGKSALALALARAFDGVVINADSMQVYAELRVLSGRPDAAEEAAVPHRLYGVVSASERFAVGRWRELATSEISAAHEAKRLPIVVGGTGLYFRGLLRGLAPIPEIPPAVRAAAARKLAALGPAGLHAALALCDPETARRLKPGDKQRIVRAWEVVSATGRGLADWQREPGERPADWRPLALVLTPPRQDLYAACDARLRRMAAAGALDEALALAGLGLDPGLPAMKAVGVREFLACARGESTLDEAIAAAQQTTRRYAKRQLTWFRHQMPNAHFIADMISNKQDSERLLSRIYPIIRGSLLTR
jgi:tRNA dimethylallyltransferase